MRVRPGATVVVDVGKSATRARLRHDEAVREATVAGVPPETAGRPGAGAALEAVVRELWTRLTAGRPCPGDAVGSVVVGSTAVPDGPALDRFADAARRLWPRAVLAFAEDGVVAHAAALGRPGVVASIGTGTVVTGLAADGAWHRMDGWGPDLGDRGSAARLGADGLRAAFAARDGVAPPTALLARAADHLGSTDLRAATRLLAAPDRVARTAAFARHVCAAAPDDAVAAGLVRTAAEEATSTIAGMADRTGERAVVVVGRLGTSRAYRGALEAALGARGHRLLEPAGGPLDVDPAVLLGQPYAPRCRIWG